MIHRLLHGHWARWEAVDYDFLTWRWRCVICRLREEGTPE